MRFLVTGATGFVGSNLALHLDKEGHEVIGQGVEGEQNLKEEGFKGKLILKPFYELNWEEIGKIDALFHQAAIVGMLNRDGSVYSGDEEIEFVNVISSLKMFEEAVKRGCKKIVYASSNSVYGHNKAPFIEWVSERPNSPYGRTKLELDKGAMEFAKKNPNVKVVGLRYPNVYGPRENHKGKSANVVYQFAQQMLKGNPKLFKYGEQKRPDIHIKDVVRANIIALNPKESCVVNCGSGKPIDFNYMIETLNNVMKTDRKIEYVDNPYPFFQSHTECDMTKAKEMLGFKAEYDLKKGIEDYYNSGWLTKEPIFPLDKIKN